MTLISRILGKRKFYLPPVPLRVRVVKYRGDGTPPVRTFLAWSNDRRLWEVWTPEAGYMTAVPVQPWWLVMAEHVRRAVNCVLLAVQG